MNFNKYPHLYGRNLVVFKSQIQFVIKFNISHTAGGNSMFLWKFGTPLYSVITHNSTI